MFELAPKQPENVGWVPIDPIEEADRVDRHLRMAREMLADRDEGQDTVVKLSFGRHIEHEGLVTYGPGEHMGILLGVDESNGGSLIVGNYEVWLVECDPETDEITTELLIEASDLAIVPAREIGDLWGAAGTPETWDVIKDIAD